MDIVKVKFDLLCKNAYSGKNSSDICEHLPTLYSYAKECDSVFETGVRGCISSWAFLYGLIQNENKKRLFMNDINTCDVSDLVNVNKDLNVDIQYEWKNNLLLELKENYDIVFIDTWHVYGQLKRELSKFAPIANKYIILHDTTVDGIYGETIRVGWDAEEQSVKSGIPVEEIKNGLWQAVEEFVEQNKDWYIKERFTNNNGLTILARK
jgi:hypothetical protein